MFLSGRIDQMKNMIKDALMKNAIVPSQDLSNNLCLPNLLPINAADKSDIIKIIKEVIANILGKTAKTNNADIKTQDAPFKTKPSFFSCSLNIEPKYLNTKLWRIFPFLEKISNIKTNKNKGIIKDNVVSLSV